MRTELHPINRRLRAAFCALLGSTLMWPAEFAAAYKVATHRNLTIAAFDASVMADATHGPLAALGIDDVEERSFRSIAPPDLTAEIVSARGLVGLGAVYEDHPEPSILGSEESEWRFVRHFVDPQQSNRGLWGRFRSSPDWVLEPEDIPDQEFSLRDAMEFYFNALTFADPELRKRETVLLLQSVGRAVHHLQDMAQPSHTRDDAHPIDLNDAYEAYTDSQFGTPQPVFPRPLP